MLPQVAGTTHADAQCKEGRGEMLLQQPAVVQSNPATCGCRNCFIYFFLCLLLFILLLLERRMQEFEVQRETENPKQPPHLTLFKAPSPPTRCKLLLTLSTIQISFLITCMSCSITAAADGWKTAHIVCHAT